MKTIAQQLNVKEFPFIIKDKNGNQIYYENSDGFWVKREYNSNGNQIYFENSEGYWAKIKFDLNGNKIYYENSKGKVEDNRPKPSCEGKIVEIDGKKYQLKEVQ
jgi:glucan-binding YG repeat protein